MTKMFVFGVEVASIAPESSVHMNDAVARSVFHLRYAYHGPQYYWVYQDDPIAPHPSHQALGRVVGGLGRRVWLYFPFGSNDFYVAPTRFGAINAFHRFI